MKTKYFFSGLVALSMLATGCGLDYDPVSDYSDVTEGVIDNNVEEVVYQNRADAESALKALY
ncbi:MAG: RagB/SusD family nutrient uptake outer membrane protein, partial [Muribaculaceae bacterium]|nr:RagB/SusD family nutrient uptake outer membrane protein [Muribaculaceae bacterium]